MPRDATRTARCAPVHETGLAGRDAAVAVARPRPRGPPKNRGCLPRAWATDYSGRNPAPGPPTVDPGRTFMKSYNLVTAIALPMILVSGCGGGGYGGGGGGYVMNLSSAPGEAALAAYVLTCFNTVISSVTAQGTADGLAAGTETDCYTVNAAGTAALFSITVTASGITLKFQ